MAPVYSTVMASAGQASAQAPQLTQSSALTTALPSWTAIAPTGQEPSHTPHPRHLSASTTAAISFHLLFVCCYARGAPAPHGAGNFPQYITPPAFCTEASKENFAIGNRPTLLASLARGTWGMGRRRHVSQRDRQPCARQSPRPVPLPPPLIHYVMLRGVDGRDVVEGDCRAVGEDERP